MLKMSHFRKIKIFSLTLAVIIAWVLFMQIIDILFQYWLDYKGKIQARHLIEQRRETK